MGESDVAEQRPTQANVPQSRLIDGLPMKLSRTVSYAVRATLQLAQMPANTPIPCRRLAEEGKMPERFLLQILRSLVTHGILVSTRGVDGGYMLNQPPDQISLLDVIEAIEGPPTDLLPSMKGPRDAPQLRLERALDKIAESSRRQLDALKLSQLITPHRD